MRAFVLLLAAMLVSSTSHGQEQVGGPLMGGPRLPPKPPILRDAWLPVGSSYPAGLARPQTNAPALCSFQRPVCVHSAAGVPPARALSALSALERAYTREVLALRLPAPLPDRGAGGSDALDMYLERGATPGLVTEHELPEVARFDSAAAFCVVGDERVADLERDAALCVGEAIGWRLDAAETPFLRRAYATHLWWVIGTPHNADYKAVDDLQAQPELGIAARESSPLAEGAALFLEYLESRRSSGEAGAFATGLVSASAEKTKPDSPAWDNEPDVFDVLRHTISDKPREQAALFADFAVTRAFVGSRDDGSHLPQLEWSQDFGRVRMDWVLPFKSLPRRVAFSHPVEPLGSIYVWLDLDAKLNERDRVGFRAEWEGPVQFAWTLVKVDADGHELGRIPGEFHESEYYSQQMLVNLIGVRGVLVVGTNLGGVEIAHPFDPDVAPYQPHQGTVYLAALD